MSAARWATAVLCAVLAWAPTAQAQTRGGFSPAPWLQDLDQLRDAMTVGYANLEWQAARGVDLPATYAKARARLKAAHDDWEGRRAIERFLAAFGDGHLEVRWPTSPQPDRAPPLTATETARPLCARLGFFDIRDDSGPALKLAGATPVGSPQSRFSTAVVVRDGRRLGILRVASFEPKGYPDLCERIAGARGLTAVSPCDEACGEAFDKATRIAFVGELASQVQALAGARPDVLLVDVSGNGGGDDSSVALARMVTVKPLHRARGAGIMGGAWAKELGDREADAAKALKAAATAERPGLQRFEAALLAARAEALKTCDRSPLWSGRPIGCSALVPEPLHKDTWSSVPAQDDPVVHARTIWTGPVLILVDGASASSAEWFAATLQDSHAGVVIGSPTFGAGCGHMTAAGPAKLAHSGGLVAMPDCLRLRANGQNEAGGVEPDVLIGFRDHDALPQRTERLARALPQVLARLEAP